MKKTRFIPVTLIAFAFLAGCNSTPQNTSLSNAHTSYNNARTNPNVASLAALELKEASDTLVKADQALSRGESTATVNHLAYLASQKVAIAQATARQKGAEQAIADAKANRTQASLDARTAEVAAANKQVASMQKTADQQTAEAEASKRQVVSMQKTADQQTEELAAATANAESDQEIIAIQERQLKDLNAKKTKRGLVITLGDVLFSSNKAQLTSGGMRNVQKLADFLKEFPHHKVLVEGYTDSKGSKSTNQKLSDRRAKTVRSALVDVSGISSDRVTTRGYGEEFPVASNDTAISRQLNRRVEIIISDENGHFAER